MITVEVDRLELRYGATTALRDISFRLDGPGICGVLGHNGSGKSSLFSVLAAFRRASGGAVRIDGEPVFENPRNTRRICLIRESGDTVESGDRVAEALTLAAELRPDWDADYAAALVDKFGIGTRKRLRELSRGRRSALGVVLGLASRAPLTIFDETYLGMDAPSRMAFYDELIAEQGTRPRTFLLASHLIDEVAPLLERVVLLDDGRLAAFEEVDALLARGVSVTGPAGAVAGIVEGLQVIGGRTLGQTRQAVVYGELDDGRRAAAVAANVELGPLSLQELIIHLAGKGERA
ncbi:MULTISPECIES: ATP-binding cassette domain-containing protein [unclassified Crossiella]|uniref:ATP-binding cassette domain-containing protein n=1 Tax=unclassified Crossiella TaxID=2620835 RepID=UPI001FFEAA44|nr:MULTISPECIES: ABC transporter ATP-binding protein [unclassified Crossiella]MCK2239183.1 ABC transporter ATP-binding protein [Crossiella sp. S99.2]MCK2251248.1 ABC transporter ATP-binding protein [Crossiella sp. S99.1]